MLVWTVLNNCDAVRLIEQLYGWCPVLIDMIDKLTTHL